MLTSTDFRLEIGGENLVAWQPINNTFAKQGQPGKNYWNGVLFQLGRYSAINGGQLDWLGEIQFWGPVGSTTRKVPKVTITRAEFGGNPPPIWWINIVPTARRAGQVDPMSKNDINKLHLDKPGYKLHEYFSPFVGGITFWHSRTNGYLLEVKRLTPITHQCRYTFCADKSDKFKVEVFKNGVAYKVNELKNIDRVVITQKKEKPPGDHQGPPQIPPPPS